MRFRNVSFFVVPDQEPFTSVPVDRRGILGVPIHFAVGTWQWSKSGTIRLGEKIPPGGSQPNLILFRNKTLVSAEIAGRSVFFTLDSGAVNTDLNSNFVGSFGDVVANAQKTTGEVTGGETGSYEVRIPVIFSRRKTANLGQNQFLSSLTDAGDPLDPARLTHGRESCRGFESELGST